METLGRGQFAWTKEERRTGRYGAAILTRPGWDESEFQAVIDEKVHEDVLEKYNHTDGRLSATVTEVPNQLKDADKDLFSIPEQGERYTVGEGKLFYEPKTPDGCIPIGVEPEDREYPWMENVHLLGRSLVDLEFEPF